MSIKVSVVLAVLAVSTVGVSACSSSASQSAAASPTSTAGAASVTSPAAPSTPDSAATASTSGAQSPANPTESQTRPPVRTDIPGNVMLLQADLAPSHAGPWQQHGGPAVVASQIVDPDNCDPVTRPQSLDAGYPRNPAWVAMRSMGWGSSQTSQVAESVITYRSDADANADFVKHRSWLATCEAHFQWTDAPAKYSISNASLKGVPDSYLIRVAMDPPNQPAPTTGSQGVDYMAVILRGNSLSVVSVSETGPVDSKPQDPGLAGVQHDVQAAAAKLTSVYTPIR